MLDINGRETGLYIEDRETRGICQEQEMKKETNYTYIVKCADGTFYTGWTNCIEKRLMDHNSGKGAKYTRPRLPVELVYLETSPTRQQAMSREAGIKKLTGERRKR